MLGLSLWSINMDIKRGLSVKVSVAEEYQKIDSINKVLVENIRMYEEERSNDISTVRNEYQHRIDSLSKVVKNINSDVTRMKRTSIMNY
jgi:hypothetical protein